MAFTGNGMSGAMVTAGNESVGDIGSVRIELGRTDVEDDRMPGSVHYIGETTKCDRRVWLLEWMLVGGLGVPVVTPGV